MKHLVVIILAIALTSCATSRYVIDLKGIDISDYYVDLEECKAYSDEVGPDDGLLVTVIAGVVLIGIAGVVAADPDSAEDIASSFDFADDPEHGIVKTETKEDIVKACLRERGYKVLD